MSQREGGEQESGPGRASEETSQNAGRYGDQDTNQREREKRGASGGRGEKSGISFPSVIFGWITTIGAGILLTGIIGGIVSAFFALIGVGGGGIAAAVGVLLTLFLIYLIGGYVSGRLASRSGVLHGLLVPVLTLVVLILLSIAGGVLGLSFAQQIQSTVTSAVPQSLSSIVPSSTPSILSLAGILAIIGAILALLMPFVGGIVGGIWGAKRGMHRP